MKKLVITKYRDKTVSILFNEKKESRIEVYSLDEEDILDNIYVGRVKDIVNNIGAAFVEIAPDMACYFSLKENKRPIFLNRKNTDKVCQGDLLLVQVKKAAIKTKAAVVSCNINFSGKYAALTREPLVAVSRKITDKDRIEALKNLVTPYVTEDYGFVIRTDAKDITDNLIEEEITALKGQYEKLVETAGTRTAFTLIKAAPPAILQDIASYKLEAEDEILTDIDEVFNLLTANEINVRFYDDSLLPLSKLYSVESKIEAALGRHIWLKSGGYLIIEYTEALTVIDVNTGKYDGKGKVKEDTFLKINLEAANEIARQLILRNISGIIIVDFVSMESYENREILKKHIDELAKQDYITTSFIDFTRLGLAEITRKKVRKPLHEQLK